MSISIPPNIEPENELQDEPIEIPEEESPEESPSLNLTPRQKAFCDEYIIDLNGMQAAIRAGYAPTSASVAASKLLTQPKVAALIAEKMRWREQRTQVTADRVVAELARIAFSDPRRLMSWKDGRVTLKDSAELTDDEAAGVASVKQSDTEAGSNVELKTVDKVRALELLSRHLGLLVDKSEISDKRESRFAGMSDDELEKARAKLKKRKAR